MERTEIERRIVEGVLRHFPECTIVKNEISEIEPKATIYLKDKNGVIKQINLEAPTWKRLIESIEYGEPIERY